MPTVKEVVSHLLNSYSGDSHIAVDIWQTDDVIGRARERGLELTKQQAIEIVDYLHNHIDNELGISWLTVDMATEECIRR